MFKRSVLVLTVGVFSIVSSGCVAVMPKQEGAAQAAGSLPDRKESAPSSKDREDAQRRALSKNHPVVEMRAKCEGLFIPVVERSMFRNVLPVFSMRMLNNSGNRYEVKYDLTLKQNTRNMYQNENSESVVEKNVTIRANQYIEVLLEQVSRSPGVTVRGVSRIEIVECKRS